MVVEQRSSIGWKGTLARRAGDSRGLTVSSLAVRAVALDVLRRDRVLLQRSIAAIASARALGSRIDATLAGRVPGAGPTAANEPAALSRPATPRCLVSGCPRPSPLHPCFVVRCGDRHVVVRDLPLRVCEAHRADLDRLFRLPSVLEALRRKLRARGREAPGAVRVLFDVVG